MMVSQFVDIRRRLDSMLLSLDVGLATIVRCKESFVLSPSPHNVHQNPLHVLLRGSILVRILVHIFVIFHHFPFCRGAPR